MELKGIKRKNGVRTKVVFRNRRTEKTVDFKIVCCFFCSAVFAFVSLCYTS